jgi:hypothetical protein
MGVGDEAEQSLGRPYRDLIGRSKDLHEAGIRGVRVEGMRQSDWVLIDAGGQTRSASLTCLRSV